MKHRPTQAEYHVMEEAEGTGAVASQEHQTLLIPEAQGGYSPDFPPVSLREQGFTDTLGFLLLAPRIVR